MPFISIHFDVLLCNEIHMNQKPNNGKSLFPYIMRSDWLTSQVYHIFQNLGRHFFSLACELRLFIASPYLCVFLLFFLNLISKFN